MGYTTAGPMPASEGTGFESRRWIFCIELDANDRVIRYQTVELDGAASLETTLRAWAGSEGP
jgi:hypothetical protein